MKKILIPFLCLILSSFNTLHNQKKDGKLIVLITIDGLRGDMLQKYKPAFKHGFKRMFAEGFDYQNTWVDHAITVSHAGHVTLATGNYPRTHGIVDAAFYEKKGDIVDFTEGFNDSTYSLAGSPAIKSISLKKVITPGLAEWVKRKDPSSKIFCVGTGNISSALYCFHKDEPVFWYNLDLGKYVTSTYYTNIIPGWITDFNDKQLPQYFSMSKEWKNIVPEEFLDLSNIDSASFERLGRKHVFPYVASERVQKENLYKGWITFTPFIDNATLALAKKGIESLAMGQRSSTDYLSIVLSQLDNTNHDFGPSSLESFNVLMQMDNALGDFYKYLDEKVGKGNYVVALSADHGFPEIPEQILQKGTWAKRIKENEIEDILREVKSVKENSKNMGKEQIAENIKTYLKKLDFVADAYTPKQLNSKTSRDNFLELYKKSYREDRVPRLPFFSLNTFTSEIGKAGVMVRLKENVIIDLDPVIHGSPYDYDRSVPLLFMGMGVKNGFSKVKTHTTDVAPSLAKLGNVPVYNKPDGKSLF